MRHILLATGVVLTLLGQATAMAQLRPSQTQRPAVAPASATRLGGPDVSASADGGFVIGPEDVLGVVFWRDSDMSGDVTVRPDGMITVPLLRDVKAAGLTPNQLADRIQENMREFVTDAAVTVIVRQVNSRKVFITGEVARPGAYPLASSMTVMQIIAIAGGLTEFADGRSISIMRVERGITRAMSFDYKEVASGRGFQQNIVLKPGDTVVVPER